MTSQHRLVLTVEPCTKNRALEQRAVEYNDAYQDETQEAGKTCGHIVNKRLQCQQLRHATNCHRQPERHGHRAGELRSVVDTSAMMSAVAKLD